MRLRLYCAAPPYAFTRRLRDILSFPLGPAMSLRQTLSCLLITCLWSVTASAQLLDFERPPINYNVKRQ